VLVTLGIPAGRRKNYLVWREGKAPDVVFEITSTSTRSDDLGSKRGLYAFLGVKEYVLFDPREEYLEPRLRLYRLRDDNYLPVVGRFHLETLGLELVVLDDQLRLLDPATNSLLPKAVERVDQAESALGQTESALAQAESARAEAESARAKAESDLAEAESARAKAESDLADSERQRAELQRRLRELEKASGGEAST
ncbi:MAG: Uma2 family endonuclease, partial [Candidatus Eremiobacteraeota bacterium]|nr:Uma2 family endonuclease [Candidatus Eremiobacteraeota bacterium]